MFGNSPVEEVGETVFNDNTGWHHSIADCEVADINLSRRNPSKVDSVRGLRCGLQIGGWGKAKSGDVVRWQRVYGPYSQLTFSTTRYTSYLDFIPSLWLCNHKYSGQLNNF